ncbi:hypothetical protein DPMN_177646 [Dreissena polymorpha]|uniref:Tyrosinase copper-binding domain-containing protein n=2 Tax=Dreissena polymorpha TaxID=45954 RepID=A0A9D4II03_DREPO|nr:hypothetical protein DPMN_177646 [Dreissena polymorpha]
MRNIDNTVSLPYWDSSLDNEMANPANTIVFSKEFFGNGDGEVITGPFANWDTHHGPLTRNIAGEGQLFSKENITTVLTRCNTAEITRPTALQPCDFERYHGGPHNWVGGQMMGLTTSSHDPVFFLHHAFVDYIWEKFRYGQLLCKPPVDPEVYPPADGLHAETNPMDGFPRYINIDGYRNYWTQNWYKYEDSPRCPICGSKYLKCDKVKRWCVPIERKLTRKEGYIVNGTFMTDAADTAISESAAEARAAVEKLDIGKKFDAPDDDYRTQRAQLARMAVGPNGRSGPRGKRTF